MTRGMRAVAGAAVVLLAATPALGQTIRIDGGVVSAPQFGFYWETHLTPPVPPLADGFGTASVLDRSGSIHRVLLDRVRKVLFGYDVSVEPEPGGSTYRLRFASLSMTAAQRQRVLGSDFARWQQLETPAFAVPGRPEQQGKAGRTEMNGVRRGQVIELHLLTTESGQRLTDYVTIQPPARFSDGVNAAPRPVFRFTPDVPADFTIGHVELELAAPRISIDGIPEPSSERSTASARGAVVWFYLARRGRFVLSLLPRADLGFRRAGEVRGSTARFTLENETFTLFSADTIAPGSSAYHLYVLHDPNWRPNYPNANVDAFIMGAADRPEYVVGSAP